MISATNHLTTAYDWGLLVNGLLCVALVCALALEPILVHLRREQVCRQLSSILFAGIGAISSAVGLFNDEPHTYWRVPLVSAAAVFGLAAWLLRRRYFYSQGDTHESDPA